MIKNAISDITGEQFYNFTVIQFSHLGKHEEALWFVRCDCGTEKIISGNALKRGTIKSCGCRRSKSSHERFFKDLTGKLFERLTVIKPALNQGQDTAWFVKCVCGTEKIVLGNSLKIGLTKSCGCLQREHAKSFGKTHGLTHTRLHTIWSNMKQRCLNPKNDNYHKYGGRGIGICDEWLNFEIFYKDVSSSYFEHVNIYGEENTTLDRIDNDGSYGPNNFRWATIKEQSSNTRMSSTSIDPLAHRRNINILSSRIRACLVRGTKRSYVFPKYTGCSIPEFKQYIESKWLSGMNWNNIGRSQKGKKVWQLDHIIGCNNFDLSKEEDLKKCFHYTNFQPLWWENHMKKDRFVIPKEN